MTRGPEEAAAELRELIREANGAVKDLRQVLREVRETIASGAQRPAEASAEAGNRELDRYSRHLQKVMNEQSAQLKRAVDDARNRVVKMLMISELRVDPGSGPGEARLLVRWADGDFDPDVPLPPGPEMEDAGT